MIACSPIWMTELPVFIPNSFLPRGPHVLEDTEQDQTTRISKAKIKQVQKLPKTMKTWISCCSVWNSQGSDINQTHVPELGKIAIVEEEKRTIYRSCLKLTKIVALLESQDSKATEKLLLIFKLFSLWCKTYKFIKLFLLKHWMTLLISV